VISAPTQEPFAPDAPFRYVGGAASLDFVNTVDWTPSGLERDRVTDYARLLEWARGAGVVEASTARRLAAAAVRRPRQAEAALEAARDARVILQEVFASVIASRQRSAALDRYNTLLANVSARLCVVPNGDVRFTPGWRDFGESPDSVLWPVVWDAARLLWSSDVEKLRMCAGRDCGWLYVDRSRNGLRRWCEMSVCGTAEKNRRRGRSATA
jgi:predicted RNA-binding Zn ribbon-like protein